jgi:hypothetical protein
MNAIVGFFMTIIQALVHTVAFGIGVSLGVVVLFLLFTKGVELHIWYLDYKHSRKGRKSGD